MKEDNILISIHSKHVTNMILGKKTVELRRRPLNVNCDTRVWIYSTMPIGKITASALISDVVVDTPSKIWSLYNKETAVSKKLFNNYFYDTNVACALILKDIEDLKTHIDLQTIRENIGKFHPPQFFKRLKNGSPELDLLHSIA